MNLPSHVSDRIPKRNYSIWRNVLLAAMLLAIAFAAFSPCFKARFIWDDNDYVTNNINLHDTAGLARIWTDPHSNWQYYPLVFTTFWIEYQGMGLDPFPYHFHNVLLHALSAVILWRLLLRLGFTPLPAWLGAAIFAVHPVQVESVAWVTERKNMLCGLFYFSAMLVFFNGSGTHLRRSDKSRSNAVSYLAALLLFTCAMFSKTVAASWPAAVLVILWWKSGEVRLRTVIHLIPFFLIGILLSSLTVQLEHTQVGAGGSDWAFSTADRCIIAGRALWFYAGKAILPVNLAFIYPKWDLHSYRALQAAVAVAAFMTPAALILLRHKIGRGPAAASLLFAGTLVPALGFFDVYPMRYSFVADHFQYLAIAPLIVPAAWILHRAAGRWAVVILLPLIVLTWRQCHIYQDSMSLWTATVAMNGTSWMTHENLGEAYQAAGDSQKAQDEYQIAAATDPTQAEAWWKLGAVQADEGRLAEAEVNFRRSLAADPAYPPAQYDLKKVMSDPRRKAQ